MPRGDPARDRQTCFSCRLKIVKENREILEKIFPDQFINNPLDAVADLLDEKGMPFEEPPGGLKDAEIEWHADDAIVGKDAPDPESASPDDPAETSLSPELRFR